MLALPTFTVPADISFDDVQFSWQAIGDWFAALMPFFPLAVAGTIVWALWLYRVILSARAKAIESDFRTTTSVIVPSFHEDPDILMRCLESWRAQNPTEIIIVLDVADLDAYDRVVALKDDRIRPILFHHAGKRSALGAGIRLARSEILVLTDSDTSWTPGLLENVQKPFADPLVGGVSTQQNVYQRGSSIWRRVADWLVDLRYYNYVPAMGRAGAVPCISGRTAVYRKAAVLPVLDNLENEFFLGRRCISGDDGRLTWLVLASGYKTVHQRSAKAVSMFPSSFGAFVKQRVRWSRNSYRTYLTAMFKGWLWRVPFVTKITVLQILLTPLTMGLTIGYLVFSRLELTTVGIWATVAWLLIGRGIRGLLAPAAASARDLPAARRDPDGDPHRPADQGLRLPHDEQAGLAHPSRGPRRRRRPDRAHPHARGGLMSTRRMRLTALAVLLGTAGSLTLPLAAQAADTPDEIVVTGDPYPGDPALESLLVAAEERRLIEVRAISNAAGWTNLNQGRPYRLVTGNTYTLVLIRRESAYTLDDLLDFAPSTFVRQPDGSYLLSENIVVEQGATLRLSSTEGLVLRLASTSDAFVSIVTIGGAIGVRGHRGQSGRGDELGSDRGDGRPDHGGRPLLPPGHRGARQVRHT